jgi:AcrR family transcriptional regulator
MLGTVEESTATFPGRYRSSVTRERIIAVSLRLFAKDGFPCTTIRDIAREAEISDAAIYYYFPTKDELLNEVLNSRLRPAAGNRKCLQRTGLQHAWQELVPEAVGMIEANHELFKIILREGLTGDPVAMNRYDQLLTAWKSHVEGCLKPLEYCGTLPPGEATSLACQIALTVAMVFEDMLLLRPDPSVSRSERLDEAKTLLTRQIRSLIAPPPARRPIPVQEDDLRVKVSAELLD